MSKPDRPVRHGGQAGFRINFSISLLPLSGTERHKRENINNAKISYILPYYVIT